MDLIENCEAIAGLAAALCTGRTSQFHIVLSATCCDEQEIQNWASLYERDLPHLASSEATDTRKSSFNKEEGGMGAERLRRHHPEKKHQITNSQTPLNTYTLMPLSHTH